MTDAEFEAIKNREALTTKGPWKQEYGFNNGGMATGFFYIPASNSEKKVEMLADDAAFIANARTDHPGADCRDRTASGPSGWSKLMSIEAFLSMISGMSGGCRAIGKALATRLDVPYHEEREKERLLGHRLKDTPEEEALKQGLFPTRRFLLKDGTILETNEWQVGSNPQQLTEEVWTKENWPESYNDILGALQRLPDGVLGIYFHRSSLNLVLVGPLGERVGIRSTAMITPIGMSPNVRDLAALKKAATA